MHISEWPTLCVLLTGRAAQVALNQPKVEPFHSLSYSIKARRAILFWMWARAWSISFAVHVQASVAALRVCVCVFSILFSVVFYFPSASFTMRLIAHCSAPRLCYVGYSLLAQQYVLRQRDAKVRAVVIGRWSFESFLSHFYVTMGIFVASDCDRTIRALHCCKWRTKFA